jgi:hypothetical protein
MTTPPAKACGTPIPIQGYRNITNTTTTSFNIATAMTLYQSHRRTVLVTPKFPSKVTKHHQHHRHIIQHRHGDDLCIVLTVAPFSFSLLRFTWLPGFSSGYQKKLQQASLALSASRASLQGCILGLPF